MVGEESVAQSDSPDTAAIFIKTHSIEAVRMAVETAIADVLGHAVGGDEPLMAAGLDSLGSVELQSTLGKKLGLKLSNTVVFDYPTVEALAAYLWSRVAPVETSAAGGAEPPAVAAATDRGAGVVEVAAALGRTPGCRDGGPGAPGSDGVRRVPLQRWDAEVVSQWHDEPPVRFGGYLAGTEKCDAGALGVSGAEATLMDPQQRCLLMLASDALVAAGGGGERHASTGVYVGISSSEYAGLGALTAVDAVSPFTTTGGAQSVASGRICYMHGFQGPAVSVDTACSSALVGAHMGTVAVGSEVCLAAVVGGVGLLLKARTTVAFANAGMLAADGRCKTLDAAADGYVRAEACGVLVL
eukprot:CAMPEP_0182906248 /NCGR_PEP_ID=MMETSP0034_2-20130328/33591_1 /TAXON_ID=156128 /ORGANISM="Nephroselmis pyriformis, Strain CCMP717" /LENGTH=355 /DNA_ID=CAMNT_0025041877 /DNA_START=41 /DNA_END=1105 /DNA_ORIENTATION=+